MQVSFEKTLDNRGNSLVDYGITSITNNVNAGSATINITGKGNYTGTKSFNFTINKLQITAAGLSSTVEDFTYTGRPIEPTKDSILNLSYRITYTDSFITLPIARDDFRIKAGGYANNTNATNNAIITLTFGGSGSNIEGEASVTFRINPKSFDDSTFIVTNNRIETYSDYDDTTGIYQGATLVPMGSYVYTGVIQRPTMYVYEDLGSGSYLELGNSDYDAEYASSLNVGSAIVAVNGRGNYTSSIYTSFEITPLNIQTALNGGLLKIVGSTKSEGKILLRDETYTRFEITPTISIVFEGTDRVLAESNYDRSIQYADNTGYGDNIVVGPNNRLTLTGKNNLTGEIIVYYTIVPKNLNDLDGEIGQIANQEYTGSPIYPATSIHIWDGEYVLQNEHDYTLQASSGDYTSSDEVNPKYIQIVGTGNYTGTITMNFFVVRRNLSSLVSDAFEINTSGIYYTGHQITSDAVDSITWTLSDNSTFEMVKDVDFTLEFTDGYNIGTRYVTVNGIGHFKNSIVLPFEILARPFDGSDADWTISLGGDVVGVDYYNNPIEIFRQIGTAISPKPTIHYTDVELIYGADYTLSFGNNINKSHNLTAGKWVTDMLDLPYVTITFMGNFEGETTCTFGISVIDIEQSDIDAQFTQIFYCGQAVTVDSDNVAITLKANSAHEAITLTYGVDYDYLFELSPHLEDGSETNNTSAGLGAIKVTFVGNFSGEIIIDFEILPLSVASDKISVDESLTASEVFTASQIVKDFSGKLLLNVTEFDTIALTEGINNDFTVEGFEAIDTGVVQITITGHGNYSGQRVIEFTILPKAIDDSFVFAAIADKAYNYGSPIYDNDAIVITYNAVELVQGEDYVISSYQDNINVGVAKVVINGTGNYQGTYSKEIFNIVSRAVTSDDLAITSVSTRYYTGEAIYLGTAENNYSAFTVLVGGKEEITIANNICSYSSNIVKGQATITLTLSGNYTGNVTLHFDVVARPYSKDMFTIPAISEQIYTGAAITPVFGTSSTFTDGRSIVFTNENGASFNLVEGTDYTLEYSKNIERGWATIRIYFKGNYANNATTTFHIVSRYPDDGMVDAALASYIILPKDATSLTSKIRYAQVRNLNDLKIVNRNDSTLQPMTSLRFAQNIAITNIGTYTVSAIFNPNPSEYRDKEVELTFTVEKGVYDIAAVSRLLDDHYSVKYHMGVSLDDITDLPAGFAFDEVDKNLDKYDISAGSDYYVVSNVHLRYNINKDLYEDLTGVTTKVYICRGDLNPLVFAYKTLSITYGEYTRINEKVLSNDSPWSWYTAEHNPDNDPNFEYPELLVADSPYTVYLEYDASKAIASEDILPQKGGFPTHVFGRQNNYNILAVPCKVIVDKANYTTSDLWGIMYSDVNYNVPTTIDYAIGLDLQTVIACGYLSVGVGFEFVNPNQKLYLGRNECYLMYNRDSQCDANYNSYGEVLSQRDFYIVLNVVAPEVEGRLNSETTSQYVVKTSVTGGMSISRTYGATLGIDGAEIPFDVYYQNKYRIDDTTGGYAWELVAGTAKWVDHSEVLNTLGDGILKALIFTASDPSIFGGTKQKLFYVEISMERVILSEAEKSAIRFLASKQDLEYSLLPTYRRIDTVSISGDTRFAYLDDVRYTYQKVVYVDGEISYYEEEKPFTMSTVLDAGGDSNDFGFFYIIRAHFDSGYCTYYDFGDYTTSINLFIKRAEVNLDMFSISRMYGDKAINNDKSMLPADLTKIDKSMYDFEILDSQGNAVVLTSKSKIGRYTMVLSLNPALVGNYNIDRYDPSYVITASYTITSRAVKDVAISLPSVLREDGTDHIGDVSIILNNEEYVDGIIPEYNIVFMKDGHRVTEVVSKGTYTVTIEFEDSSYYTNKTISFQVYGEESVDTLLIVAIVVGSALVLTGGTIFAIRTVRRNKKKSLAKAKLKAATKELGADNLKDAMNKASDANSSDQSEGNNNMG